MSKIGDFLHKLKHSSLAKDSVIYIVSEGIAKAIPFLLLPFLSYYLSPADYGKITNFNVISQILIVLCCSLYLLILQAKYYKIDEEERKSFVSTIIWLSSVTTIILCFSVLFYGEFVYKYTDIAIKYQIISLVTTWLSTLIHVLLTIWRCERKALRFGIFHISQSAIDVGCSILLVMLLLMGWTGRINAIFISHIIIGFLSLIILIKSGFYRFRFSKIYTKEIMVFVLPLLPHGLSFWLKSGVDKLLLTNLSGLDSNGLYSVALTFGAIVSIVLTAFNNAYIPYLFKNLSSIDKNEMEKFPQQKKIIKMTKLIMLGLGLFCLLTYFVSILVIKIFYQHSYHDSIYYLPWIILSQFFYGIYSLMVNFIHYSQKTAKLGVMTFSLALLQILLSYLLIVKIGSIGSAVSSAIIAFITMIAISLLSIKTYKLPWFKS